MYVMWCLDIVISIVYSLLIMRLWGTRSRRHIRTRNVSKAPTHTSQPKHRLRFIVKLILITDMAGVNNQSIHNNYTYSIPSDQGYYMDSNYTYSLPWDQMHYTDPDYANSLPPVSRGSNGIYLQPPSQVCFPSDTGPLDNNNISTSENEPFCTPPYGYVENNENRVNNSVLPMNYNSSNTVYSPFIYQTLGQMQSNYTFSNNASMMTCHGQVIIIMNADIDLERLLSIIQSCARVERIYM